MSIIASVSLTATDAGAFTQNLDRIMALADTAVDHGGRHLAKGGSIETVTGEALPDRVVVVAFDHVGQARAWMRSEEFGGLTELAGTCSQVQTMIVEGL
ncbi:DUF1330 domain-containing protein [Candidatus Poriferisocius sp.]|uniref:DUF1330 domain-containing protein n=1 Tax=Candidatus Poriferisocius sp. TaxID=3101276 RepID=UPI003B022D3C